MEMACLPAYPLSYRVGQDTAVRQNRLEQESEDHWVPYGQGEMTLWREFREILWLPPRRGGNLADPLFHAEYALRHEPLNLAVLAQALPQLVTPEQLADFVRSRPSSRYRRCLWFLYEFFSGSEVPLPDLKALTTARNLVPIQDPDRYVVNDRGSVSRRHGVVNNLLGTREFCPVLRQSEMLQNVSLTDYIGEFRELLEKVPVALREDLADHLYVVESRDSFALEGERLDPRAGRRFVELLRRAHEQDFLTLEGLAELQEHIHGRETPYVGAGLRTRQNYIGFPQSGLKAPYVTRPTAPSTALPSLVQGVIDTHRQLCDSTVPPLPHAAAISYGLLFIHSFRDGNNRTHRFLLHNILAHRGYTQPGELFPLSTRMLSAREQYAQSMYPFQAHIRQAVEYQWGNHEEFQHLNDTIAWFRYPDLSEQAVQVHLFVDDLLEYTLPAVCTERSRFLRACEACREITFYSTRKAEALVSAILRNEGRLSKRKQRSMQLRDPEIVAACEEAVHQAYQWEVLPVDYWEERPAPAHSETA